jgi:hypothetical protein
MTECDFHMTDGSVCGKPAALVMTTRNGRRIAKCAEHQEEWAVFAKKAGWIVESGTATPPSTTPES